MSGEQQPRPGQATMAAFLISGGSVFVVLAAWERIAGLRSIESQEELRRTLDEPGFSGLGLGIEGLTSLVQVVAIVGAAAATAAVVLGIHTLRRDRLARIALTVLAPFILIGGMTISGFVAALVVVGITLLWMQPTRDWYAGRPWLQLFEQRRDARLAQLRSASAERAARAQGRTGQAKHLMPPPGQPGQPGQPAPGANPWTTHPPVPGPVPPAPLVPMPPPARAQRGPRPQAVLVACALTWLGAAVAALVGIVRAARFGTHQAEIVREFESVYNRSIEDMGVTVGMIEAAYWVLAGLTVLWALVAAALAVLTLLGHNWARITLVVSASVAGLLALLATSGEPANLVLVLIVGATMWLLLRPSTSLWFRRR